MGTRFISEETLKSLAENSLEHVRFLLREALTTIFPGVRTNLVCTFSQSAVVVTESGDLHRVTFEVVKGKLRGVTTDLVDLPLHEARHPAVLRAQARDVVTMLAAGRRQEAQSVMENLVIRAPLRLNYEEEVTTAFVDLVQRDRPWRRRLEARMDEMRRFIGAGALKVEAATPGSQFTGESWHGLKGRVSILSRLARVAKRQWEGMRSRLSQEESREFLTPFQDLCGDFFDDLNHVHHALMDSARVVSTPIQLGRMHDALAEELQKFELVGAFISETVKRFEGTLPT